MPPSTTNHHLLQGFDGLDVLLVDTLHFVDVDFDRGTMQGNAQGRSRLQKLVRYLPASCGETMSCRLVSLRSFPADALAIVIVAKLIDTPCAQMV